MPSKMAPIKLHVPSKITNLSPHVGKALDLRENEKILPGTAWVIHNKIWAVRRGKNLIYLMHLLPRTQKLTCYKTIMQ